MVDKGERQDQPDVVRPTAAPEHNQAAETKRQAPRVAPAVKPGPLARLWQTCCAPFNRIKLPQWNLRNFAWGLLALFVIVLVASNWAPMRFFLFGLWIELPRALSVIVLLGVGFLVGWFTRSPKRPEQEQEPAKGQEEAESGQ